MIYPVIIKSMVQKMFVLIIKNLIFSLYLCKEIFFFIWGTVFCILPNNCFIYLLHCNYMPNIIKNILQNVKTF